MPTWCVSAFGVRDATNEVWKAIHTNIEGLIQEVLCIHIFHISQTVEIGPKRLEIPY